MRFPPTTSRDFPKRWWNPVKPRSPDALVYHRMPKISEIWRIRHVPRDGSFNRKKLVGLENSFELVINGLIPPQTLKT